MPHENEQLHNGRQMSVDNKAAHTAASSKPHPLIFAHYYDLASTTQIIRDLAEGMLDTFKVTVICVVPSYLGVIHAAERIIGTQFRTYFSTNLSLNPGLNLFTGGAA